jgi:hypothetical protein
MCPSLAQLCDKDEKTEEHGRKNGWRQVAQDNTNKMLRSAILSLQTS